MREVLEYLKKEWAVLKRAPLSFVGLAMIFFGAGLGAGLWHYSERLEIKDGEIHRYRVAMGIDEASKGALVELNNQELALKAQSIVLHLRQFTFELDAKCTAINQRLKSGEIDEQQAGKDTMDAMKEVSQDFDRNLASDTYNVENELRSRLDPSAMSHILRVPAFMINNDPRSRVTFSDLARGSGFDAGMLGRLADEIEQMANLLSHG
jgi:hypothetical protein